MLLKTKHCPFSQAGRRGFESHLPLQNQQLTGTPKTYILLHYIKGLSIGSIPSGNQISCLEPTCNPKNSRGVTPITVTGTSSTSICLPRMAESPWNLLFQMESVVPNGICCSNRTAHHRHRRTGTHPVIFRIDQTADHGSHAQGGEEVPGHNRRPLSPVRGLRHALGNGHSSGNRQSCPRTSERGQAGTNPARRRRSTGPDRETC
jgi:hypothetical protein